MSAPQPTAKCGVFTVHSEVKQRPMLRTFAKSRVEAEAQMKSLQASDPVPDYWIVELTYGELEDFRQFGMLPEGF
jgi:hypothetical protein